MEVTTEVRAALETIYEEIMWLSRLPNVTPSKARAWYTHVMAGTLSRHLRRFTGQVSVLASESPNEPLMLEHFKRIQTTLSDLVERHRRDGRVFSDEFVRLVVEYEQVHIVTRSQNYAAMRAKGDYTAAGIELRVWSTIPPSRQTELWLSMLRGKVANARDYVPGTKAV